MLFPTVIAAVGGAASDDALTLMRVFIVIFSIVGVLYVSTYRPRVKKRHYILNRIGVALYFVAILVFGYIGPSTALAASELYGLPYNLYVGISAGIVIIGSGLVFFGTIVPELLQLFRGRPKPPIKEPVSESADH